MYQHFLEIIRQIQEPHAVCDQDMAYAQIAE